MGFGPIHLKFRILLQQNIFLWLPRSLDTIGANLAKMSCIIELGQLPIYFLVFKFVHDGDQGIFGALVTEVLLLLCQVTLLRFVAHAITTYTVTHLTDT